ncbi:galactosyl transferase [Albimonas pacifica]|uniref:Galactosyl transferase n=1 Tax=Albimonas pacifica TaxID=1114924 RepID=A0A1I3FFZ6_9RHOB|nr:galactosyl transferase [Albimonas pacifica]SFI10148.1 hypothetical protein SAMN05216258_104262 [Albimonas pacifica]
MSTAPHLTFVVPIRHPQNARDWALEKANLARTARSIAGQTAPGWRAVVVANEGADLPPLPAGFEVARVNHPPNPGHDLVKTDRQAAWAVFRRDKGRRVADGLRAAGASRYFMIVDGDDLVSNRLSAHVLENDGANGWVFESGWCLDADGRFAMKLTERFEKVCGTSHILRADLFALPEPETPGYWERVELMLGSHVRVAGQVAQEGRPIAPLPFPGAAYLVGHANAHSLSRGVLRRYFLNGNLVRQPAATLGQLRHLHRVGPAFRQEFMGAPD